MQIAKCKLQIVNWVDCPDATGGEIAHLFEGRTELGASCWSMNQPLANVLWVRAVELVGTTLIFSVPIIVALLTHGRTKALTSENQDEVAFFHVWRGFYLLGAALAALGLIAFGFFLIDADTALQRWIVCSAGLAIAGLGTVIIYATCVSSMSVGRCWVEVKDLWRVRRFAFADLKQIQKSGGGFVLDDGSKRLYQSMIYTNSSALLELLERRRADAHSDGSLK